MAVDNLKNSLPDYNRMEALEKCANIASFEWDPKTNDFFWSDQVWSIIKSTPTETPASLHSLLSFIHPNDQQQIQTLFENLFRTHEKFRLFTHILRSNGEEIPIVLSMDYNEIGDVFHGYIQDKSEDVQDRADLVNAMSKYRAVMNGAADAILLLSLEGDILEGNTRAAELLQVSESDLTKLSVNDIHPQEELDNAMGHYQALLWGDTQTIETRIIGQHKTVTPIQISGRVINLGGQQILITIFHDISAQKRAQEDLFRSERRYRTLVDEARESILMLDEEANIMSVNPRLCDSTKISKHDLLRLNFADITEFEMEYLPLQLLQASNTRKSLNVEGSLKTNDGILIPTGFNISSFQDEGHRRYIVTAYDLSEVRQGEHERMALQMQLFQAQKQEVMGQLAGSLAHDFNNLLSPILLISEALSDSTKEPFTRENLQKITKAADRAKRLVSRILAYTRPQESSFELLDLKQIVSEVVELLGASIPHTIVVSNHIEDGKYICRADPDQINQVVMNIGTNAVHAIGSENGQVDFSLCQFEIDETHPFINEFELPEGKYAIITCKDTGPGVAEDDLERIFEPFFTTKAQTDGSGLGLSSVRRIAENHGGYVRALNNPDGACFEFYIPLEQEGIDG